jgi:hypothetical protein
VLVCAGAWGFAKDAGLVISETTWGGRPSAGKRIASNDCIKSIAEPEHPNAISQRRRSGFVGATDDAHRLKSKHEMNSFRSLFFFVVLGERKRWVSLWSPRSSESQVVPSRRD